jgi:hypothetical protein
MRCPVVAKRVLVRLIRGERGAILALTVILSTFGIVVSTSALALVGGHLQVSKTYEVRGASYYTAKAGMDAAMADMLLGVNLLRQGYQPPQLTVNNLPVTVTVAAPAGAFRPKAVFRYVDPGVQTGLASLGPGNAWTVRLEGVQPFSVLGVGWAFDDTSPPSVRIEIEDPTGAKAVAEDERTKSPLQLLVRSGTSTEYVVRFTNTGTTPVLSLPFSSLGDDSKTWILGKMTGREYILEAAAGEASYALRAYVRQIPGPDQPGAVPQIIVVETWRRTTE